MTTEVLATVAAVQIVRVAVAAAAAGRTAAGLPLLDRRSLPRWSGVRSMSGGDAEAKRRMPARLAQKQQLLDAAPAYPDDTNTPIPKVSLERVTLSFARSGGAGAQNVTKVKRRTAATKKKVSVDEKENEVKVPEKFLGSDGEDEDEDVTDWPPLVCCFGEALYEFLPSVRVSKKQQHPDIYSTWKGLQWSPPEWARLPGSFPSNVAVALARLGGRVAFMGKVGDDEHGRDIVLQLNNSGVQTRAVKFDSSCSTGVSRLRLTNGAGQVRMTCVRPSAEDSFVKSEINMDVLKESRFFQFTSFSLTSEPIRSTLFAAINEAKRNGADIVFDVNLPLRYWRSVNEARELLQVAWKESSIVEVTKHELEFILGEEYYEMLRTKGPEYFSTSVEQTKKRRYHYHYEPEEIAPLWHKKMKILLVTDGTFWIHYYTPTFHGKVAGTEDVLVTPFSCDRTGSGDAVMAAILRKLSTQPELLQDEVKLQKALRFCLCAGIIAQWTKGAIRGMPSESATQNLTEQVYPHHMIF